MVRDNLVDLTDQRKIKYGKMMNKRIIIEYMRKQSANTKP